MTTRRTGIARDLLAIACGGGLYGFAIGCGKSLLYGWRSLLKVPLLLLGTALLCALACHVVARFLGIALPFVAVQRVWVQTFRTTALLLASLAPVSLFLGQTMHRPDADGLHGYPAFLGVNMLFTAIAGALALGLQTRLLLQVHGVPLRRARACVAAWLALALLVGGQLAFWLRPFFGIASLTGEPPFLLGDEPTVTGARNVYEVVWQIVAGTGR